MKTLLTTVVISFIKLNSFAQPNMRNTQWKGQIIRQGNSREVKMEFKQDTFMSIEIMNLIVTFAFRSYFHAGLKKGKNEKD